MIQGWQGGPKRLLARFPFDDLTLRKYYLEYTNHETNMACDLLSNVEDLEKSDGTSIKNRRCR